MTSSWVGRLSSRIKRRRSSKNTKPQDEATRQGARSKERESWKHREELLDINHPPLNLLPRIRDLECPLLSPAKLDGRLQQTFEQEQSEFFQLPVELRLEIYGNLFAHRTIHLHGGFFPGDWRGGRIRRKSFFADIKTEEQKAEVQGLSLRSLPNQWHFFHSTCSENRRFAPRCADWQYTLSWQDAGHRQCVYRAKSSSGLWSCEPFQTESVGAISLLLTCRKV